MSHRVYLTRQISLPQNTIGLADCDPTIVTPDGTLVQAYLVAGYLERSAWYRFEKGPFPPPFFISAQTIGSTVQYSIFFNEFSGQSCPQLNCVISCTNQTVTFTPPGTQDPTSTTFCINGERPSYHFSVTYESEGDRQSLPSTFRFKFEDSNSNFQIIDVDSITNIIPMSPMTASTYDPDNGSQINHVGVVYKTYRFNAVNGITQFKIQKSINGGKTVHSDLCSWWNVIDEDQNFKPKKHRNYFTDREITPKDVPAYRVSFRNEYGEESLWSDWAVVK